MGTLAAKAMQENKKMNTVQLQLLGQLALRLEEGVASYPERCRSWISYECQLSGQRGQAAPGDVLRAGLLRIHLYVFIRNRQVTPKRPLACCQQLVWSTHGCSQVLQFIFRTRTAGLSAPAS